MRDLMRVKHYSIRTEGSYLAWTKWSKCIPTVLSAEEVSRIVVSLQGTAKLQVRLLYGSGLR